MKTRLATYATILLTIILLSSCAKKEELKVMTVTGEIPASKMGIALTHEHVLVDFIGADSITPNRYVKDSVVVKVLPYLNELKQYNVRTFVECTPEFLGRDPELLVELSQKTGINMITNTGWYSANDYKHLPQEVNTMSAEEISMLWIDEAKNGIRNTGVKPGFIKIAINDPLLSETDQKLVKAAALTHLSTGLTIMSHTGVADGAIAQLKILKENGVDPSAFIWAHAIIELKKENLLVAAERGAWIGLDQINGDFASMKRAVNILSYMKFTRTLDRVLISHDAGWYRPGEPNGGEFRGFNEIFDTLIPLLKLEGFTQEEIDQILVKNPAEAFAIRVRADKASK